MANEKSKIQTFEDLKVWQVAREVKNDVFGISKKFRREEKYRLTDQNSSGLTFYF
jgi:hypothetical protein